MNAAAKTYDGENKYIRITDIDESSSKYSQNVPVSPKGDLQEKYLVKKNNILFARTGASTGKSYLYNTDDGKLYYAGFLIRAKIKDLYNANFIFYQTETANYQKWVKVMSMRSGQPGINSKEYASFKFWIPSKLEQNKIASFIIAINKRIETQNKIIENLESLMKGLRKKIFLQQLRFKNDKRESFSDWKEKKIESVLKIGSGKDYKHLKEGNIPVFGTGGLMTLVDDYLYEGESVGIGRKGTIDKPVFLKGKFWTVDTLFYTHSFKEVLPKFIYYLFLQINWKNYNEASGVPSLSKNTLKKIKVKLPCLKEQIKIVNFLSSLDEKVESEKQLLHQFEQQKKHLLQNMFI